MSRPSLAILTIILIILLVSCRPAAPQAGVQPSSVGETPKPARVVLAIGAEIDNLSTKLGGGTNAAEYNFMSSSPLALRDAQGIARPLLAIELPSRDKGTWVVNADGTMRTTWKIKPNALWHDGQPVTAQDFAFAHRVALDPAMPVANRNPEAFMDRVESLDGNTFVIHWNRTYPWANELIARDLEPLPVHIMGAVYEAADSDAFLNHRFWSSPDYVGTGPYMLVQWEPGAQLVYRAFEKYFMGRPKIDEVVFRIIPDTNTMLASLLAGDVHTSVGATALGQQAGATLKEQWEQEGKGTVVITPVRFRHTQLQFNPSYSEQSALLDPRVRRAIAHGINREELARVVTAGLSGPTEIFLSPTDPLYQQAQQVIARYPHDPNRALGLLQEAGWTKDPSGAVTDSRRTRFKLDIRSTQSTDNQTELSIMAADLRTLGMEITETVVPQSRIRDSEYRIKFPGLNNTALSIEIPDTLRRGVAAECPDPARRYSGGNRGCWTNEEFDRFYLVASTSLDRAERGNAMVQALKILTEDVGIIGLTYNSENIPVPKGLVGPGPRWPGQVGNTWNIHEWRWQ